MRAQQRFRLAWAFVEYKQNLHWMHSFLYKDNKNYDQTVGCACWFESSLGAHHVKRYIFSSCGSVSTPIDILTIC